MSKDKLMDIYQNNEAFRVRVDSDLVLKNMFRIATKIEGFPRHTSMHAAGVVISKENVETIINNGIGEVFTKVLKDCAVFKDENLDEFERFILSI